MLSLMTGKQSPFGRVVLLTGPESLLVGRAADEIRTAALREQPHADVHDVEAPALEAHRLTEITGESLFAAASVVIIRDLGSLAADLHDRVVALATQPPPEVALVLLHDGGQKGRGLVTKLKKIKPGIRDFPRLKPKEFAGFVTGEARRAKVRIDPETTDFLISAVGQDLHALAAAVSQLAADREGDELSLELARRYFGGRAEAKSFVVADAVLAGQTTKALEELRWALDISTPPVLITSALASGLRGLGRLYSDRSGMGDNDLGHEIGVPPWKLRSMRQQLRGWDEGGLERAIGHVAQADADVKGAAGEPEYALERCLLAIARCRRH
jgi:DNA polymerase-3 subunit delta